MLVDEKALQRITLALLAVSMAINFFYFITNPEAKLSGDLIETTAAIKQFNEYGFFGLNPMFGENGYRLFGNYPPIPLIIGGLFSLVFDYNVVTAAMSVALQAAIFYLLYYRVFSKVDLEWRLLLSVFFPFATVFGFPMFFAFRLRSLISLIFIVLLFTLDRKGRNYGPMAAVLSAAAFLSQPLMGMFTWFFYTARAAEEKDWKTAGWFVAAPIFSSLFYLDLFAQVGVESEFLGSILFSASHTQNAFLGPVCLIAVLLVADLSRNSAKAAALVLGALAIITTSILFGVNEIVLALVPFKQGLVYPVALLPLSFILVAESAREGKMKKNMLAFFWMAIIVFSAMDFGAKAAAEMDRFSEAKNAVDAMEDAGITHMLGIIALMHGDDVYFIHSEYTVGSAAYVMGKNFTFINRPLMGQMDRGGIYEEGARLIRDIAERGGECEELARNVSAKTRYLLLQIVQATGEEDPKGVLFDASYLEGCGIAAVASSGTYGIYDLKPVAG